MGHNRISKALRRPSALWNVFPGPGWLRFASRRLWQEGETTQRALSGRICLCICLCGLLLQVSLILWKNLAGIQRAEIPQYATQGVHRTGGVRDFTALLFLSSELLTFRNCFPFNSFVICSTVQCFTLSGHSRAQRALPEEPRHNGKGFSLGSRHIPEKELYLGQVFPQVSTGNAE